MGLIENVKFIMKRVAADGGRYIYMDELADELNIRFKQGLTDKVGRKGEVTATAAEVLAERLTKMGETFKDPDVGIDWPFEVVSHRFRADSGLDFEPRLIREIPLKDGKGEPKMNADGSPAMQRYYMPVFAFVDVASKQAETLAADFAKEYAPQLEGNATVTHDGTRVVIEFYQPKQALKAVA